MTNREESVFFRKIKPCIEKYMPCYSPSSSSSKECEIQFESTFELSYGNSGFRDKYKATGCELLNVFNKCGILVGLLFIKYNYERAIRYNLFHYSFEEGKNVIHHKLLNNLKHKIRWKNVGIIITASHNAHDENGVKIIDQNGRQINELYENYLSELVNKHLRYLKKNKKCIIDDIVHDIINFIAQFFKEEINIDIYDNEIFNNINKLDNIIHYCNVNNVLKGNVCIGFDTRTSSIHLNNIIIETLNSLNIYKCINNMCYVTTPCMHFIVYFFNEIFIDQKLDTEVVKDEKYVIHKKKGDLNYMNNFHIQETKSIMDLYYFGREIKQNNSSYDSLKNHNDEEETDLKNKFHKFKDHLQMENYCPSEGNKLHHRNWHHLVAHNSDRIYYDYFIRSFEKLYNYINEIFNDILKKNCKEEIIYVDCSNGIASLKLDNFHDIFKILKKKIIKINFLQDEKSVLNFHCGADYVYRKRKIPRNGIKLIQNPKTKLCSFDGDADRVVYLYVNDTLPASLKEKKEEIAREIISTEGVGKNEGVPLHGNVNCVAILDGPKIICLFFKCIAKMLSHVEVKKKCQNEGSGKNGPNEPNTLSKPKEQNEQPEERKKIDINIIHTAYVNSAFINHINEEKNFANKNIELFRHINVNIICTKTGIKHLDNMARKSTIAILFEPNGHGSIYTNLQELNDWSIHLCIQNDRYFVALKNFLLFFNQTSGDAIVDFIAIELSLTFLNLTINDWDQFFTPLPSLYINLPCPKYVLDNIIPHPDHEKYLIKPQGLQNRIDKIVFEIDPTHGRCFIRPSGTEILLRIYAEAQTLRQRDHILDKVKQALLQYIHETDMCSSHES
ncbi:phosphoacetylglucosamine mutase [Plasmodium gonderi]|uniref:Phosphoacetylglucosamine mutase n=1 Tax=Plasmodium gonderi TaxID=77519 RepID=A0A1Y1JHE3_PLAGO|nr:phosphoacetylglucosamine mutase [Plasmodium gonderi]GAW81068.1 phosphoacetylglucosamine mutase [Plasmodium gonderi]